MGRAVICSRTPGQPTCSWTARPDLRSPRPAALRSAIERLLAHPEDAERMGRAGRRLVERDELGRLRAAIERVRDGRPGRVVGLSVLAPSATAPETSATAGGRMKRAGGPPLRAGESRAGYSGGRRPVSRVGCCPSGTPLEARLPSSRAALASPAPTETEAGADADEPRARELLAETLDEPLLRDLAERDVDDIGPGTEVNFVCEISGRRPSSQSPDARHSAAPGDAHGAHRPRLRRPRACRPRGISTCLLRGSGGQALDEIRPATRSGSGVPLQPARPDERHSVGHRERGPRAQRGVTGIAREVPEMIEVGVTIHPPSPAASRSSTPGPDQPRRHGVKLAQAPILTTCAGRCAVDCLSSAVGSGRRRRAGVGGSGRPTGVGRRCEKAGIDRNLPEDIPAGANSTRAGANWTSVARPRR